MYKKISKSQAIQLLDALMERKSLSTYETKQLFTYVYTYDLNGYIFSMLTAAIHTKGEIADELTGIVNATRSLMPKLSLDSTVTDTSGTGGGSFKTINVSTAAAFVVAAAGYNVLKSCFTGITSSVGSADIFRKYGIDVFSLETSQVKTLCEQTGIAPYFANTISPKLANRAALSRKIFWDDQIKVRTPYHLTTNLCAPCTMTERIYGCYSPQLLLKFANVFKRLNYKHTITFFADIGMSEVSNVGNTLVVEQKGSFITQYVLTPGLLGVTGRKKEDIAFISPEQSYKDFEEILQNKSSPAKQDLVAINAGAALYVLEDVVSIKEGVLKAKKILASGKAYQILQKLVKCYGIITNG